MNFLREKLKKQRVYLKFDNIKYDNNNNLLVYLYLKNKTFINAHLLKTGLVEVDESFDYMYKEKFIKLKGKSNA
jgi:site-specific DNA-methyltransferase (adenine-specific)